MAAFCHGNGSDHCCYVDGAVCPFLEVDTVSGRHWVCGLRRELGSWEAVHTDPRYLEQVQPAWIAAGVDDCGDFRGGRPEGRAQGEVVPQCCFADQYEVVFNTHGQGGVKNGERSADRGVGAKATGRSS